MSLHRVCVLCVAIQVRVWHRKGCDGNAVVQTGYRHGSETLATLLGCGKTPLSPPESTPSHHNKHPAIWRSVGMPPSATVVASTTALPTVCGHQQRRSRVMSPWKQQQQTKPHKNRLSRVRKNTEQYQYLLPLSCLKQYCQCFHFRGKWKTIIILYEWCWKQKKRGQGKRFCMFERLFGLICYVWNTEKKMQFRILDAGPCCLKR